MSRSRAFNRFSRVTAKRRRLSLRTRLPIQSNELSKGAETFDNSQELRKQALQKEALYELRESESLT